MFSKFFINRPIFATVLAIVIVLAGLMTVTTLPIAQFPDITPPTVMVSATYPGADASTVAQSIAVPIEEQVNGTEGMLYMSSNCSDGSYQLTITFENGVDVDEAAVEVQNRVAMADSQLPNAVKQQGVDVSKQSSDQLMFIAMTSDDAKRYDALYLTNYAQLHIVDPLSRVEGVGNVGAFGGGEYDMRVWLDPNKMKMRGVTPSEVNAAIEAQNIRTSAGAVGEEPHADGAQFVYTISADGGLKDADQFGDVIIRTNEEGGVLRLRDVARIELGRSSYGQQARLNGQATAMIGINQLPGANAIAVADGVSRELDNLRQYLPDGVNFQVIMNATDYVHESIDEVLVTFIETTLIVMVVILLFLQNWRAVIIPMLTIPVSLIGTFAVMKLMGFSLNTLSLFGLVLAIAIVVDDAIVVVEDCQRIVDHGLMNRKEAAIKAMQELTGPVVGEVLVLLSVFIPCAFISGITGSLYKQFALTIAVSTAFSGFNALTLTPSLCALFLAPRKPTDFFIYRWFNKGYGVVMNFYEKVTTKILGHAKLSMLVFVSIIVVAFIGYLNWPSSYLPSEDNGYFLASVQLAQGASLSRTDAAMDRLSAALRKEIPYIKDVMTISGAGMMGGGSGSNSGTAIVTLVPWKERGSKGSVDKVMDKVYEIAGRECPQAIVFAANPPSIPGLGMSSGLSMQLLDINNLGATEIKKALDDLQQAAMATGKFSDINSNYQSGVPQYSVKIDRDKAAMRHLNIEDIYSTLSAYLGGSYAGDFVDFNNLFQITVRADGDSRARPEDIENITVQNSDGEMVPFGAFGKVEPSMGESNISRYNMYTTASLTAIPKHGVSSSVAIQTLEELTKTVLGSNFSYAWSGIAYQETHASTTISFVFIFSIIMTMLVLAAQYESWTDPMAVVWAMPVAVLGCLVGCMFMGQSVGIYTQIGLILLLGMAAKNAILIVEYAMDFRKGGVDITKAAHDAGVIRFRPIMMTALAFIFGVMPMMFATGAGSGSRREIGAAIVWGMTINAILGTLFVPLFWKILQQFGEKYLSKLFVLPTRGVSSAKADVASGDASLPDNV